MGWAVSAARDDNLLAQRDEALDALLDVIDSGAGERFTYADQLANQFSQNRGLVYSRLELWLDWWRDLLLVKTGSDEAATNSDRMETLREMAGGLNLVQIAAFVHSIRTAADELRMNASPKLALEVLMLDIPEPSAGRAAV
jgi:DNA polymerase-3 subunit delta'